MDKPAIVTEAWRILEPVDLKDFEVFAGAAEAERYDAYQQALGFTLPIEFREFSLSNLGGVYITAREEIWPQAKEFDVGPAWTFWRGVMVFGLGAEVPDWLSLEAKLGEVHKHQIEDFAPVFKVQGSPYLYGFRPDHSLAVFDGYELVADEAGCFIELFRREVEALLERVEEMKARLAGRS
ncbi:hypothetical protein [Pseudomonas sp. KB-10]|uniref:hypothetical protein n=1 Tax=Pseudomonas sp. KB-10 TaxID=2292264 RepID=UPI001BB0D121|nr:hypothetical protein [Pseudomonas sp. KB-10]